MRPADDALDQAIARQEAAYVEARVWRLDDELLAALARTMSVQIERGSPEARDSWIRLAALGRVMAARFPADPDAAFAPADPALHPGAAASAGRASALPRLRPPAIDFVGAALPREED